MSAVASPVPAARMRRRVAALPAHVVTAAGLTTLVAASLLLRSTAIHAGFWIDEGLSVGIAEHSFFHIPSVLRQDGSPPLYYMLLGLWIRVFSDGQATTHVLSLLFALATIPAAWWAGRSLFDERSAWACAALAALNPFLTYYAQETRMYALVVLLSTVTAALHAHAFAHRRAWARVPFGISLVLLMYAHNWGLFFAVGSVIALLPVWLSTAPEARRGLRRDVLVSYAVTAVLYLPWLPTLAFQAAHTGAPWSERPSVADVFGPLSGILGGSAVPLALALVGGAGLGAIVSASRPRARSRRATDESNVRWQAPHGTAIWSLVILAATTLFFGWLSSQASPAFTGRYLAVLVGPLVLLAGVGVTHAGKAGLVLLAVVLVLWVQPRTSDVDGKSDARLIGARLAPGLKPGDLVVSVHPEQAPVLHYYLSHDGVGHLKWATSLGPMADPKVFDWRDALTKLRAADSDSTLDDLVSGMKPGRTVAVVLPIIRTSKWGAPWTRLVRRRAAQWERAADRNPRLVRLGPVARFAGARLPRGLRAIRYRVRAVPSGFTPAG